MRRRKRRPPETDPEHWDARWVLPPDHPAHPAAPLTDLALSYSNASGGFRNYELLRELNEVDDEGRPLPRHLHIRQPAPEWLQEVLDGLRGPTAIRRETEPTSYDDHRRPCRHCGALVLHVDVLKGDTLLPLSFCECQLPAHLKAKSEQLELERRRREERERQQAEANRLAAAERKRLLAAAQDCATIQLRMHRRCTDATQSFPECALCTLRTKKATEKRERLKKNG